MDLRLRKLIDSLQKHEVDAFLVTKDINIEYLTRFPAQESWLLVSKHQSFYITDFRYVQEARKGLRAIKIKQYTKSIYLGLAELTKSLKLKKLGFDSRHLSLAQYEALKKQCPQLKMFQTNNLVENLRAIKDDDEIGKIRKALRIHKQALEFCKNLLKPGISEREVFLQLEEFVRSRAVKFSFPPIIASGPNSSYPHAKITDRKIRLNEVILIDMGIDVEGYKSDLTRIFFLGKIPQPIERINSYVREAQHKAIEKIQPGVAVAEVDQAARNYLKEYKLDKFFGHALGHGVGLEVHENPRLSQNDPALLKEGMIVTVEPAVYIPNQFGIRIEDMVLVTKKNCEVLSAHIH